MLRDGVLAGWVVRGWSVDRDRLGSGGVFGGGGGGCGEGGELGEGAACVRGGVESGECIGEGKWKDNIESHPRQLIFLR